jgi:hypothetical protein
MADGYLRLPGGGSVTGTDRWRNWNGRTVITLGVKHLRVGVEVAALPHPALAPVYA